MSSVHHALLNDIVKRQVAAAVRLEEKYAALLSVSAEAFLSRFRDDLLQQAELCPTRQDFYACFFDSQDPSVAEREHANDTRAFYRLLCDYMVCLASERYWYYDFSFSTMNEGGIMCVVVRRDA